MNGGDEKCIKNCSLKDLKRPVGRPRYRWKVILKRVSVK